MLSTGSKVNRWKRRHMWFSEQHWQFITHCTVQERIIWCRRHGRNYFIWMIFQSKNITLNEENMMKNQFVMETRFQKKKRSDPCVRRRDFLRNPPWTSRRAVHGQLWPGHYVPQVHRCIIYVLLFHYVTCHIYGTPFTVCVYVWSCDA